MGKCHQTLSIFLVSSNIEWTSTTSVSPFCNKPMMCFLLLSSSFNMLFKALRVWAQFMTKFVPLEKTRKYWDGWEKYRKLLFLTRSQSAIEEGICELQLEWQAIFACVKIHWGCKKFFQTSPFRSKERKRANVLRLISRLNSFQKAVLAGPVIQQKKLRVCRMSCAKNLGNWRRFVHVSKH